MYLCKIYTYVSILCEELSTLSEKPKNTRCYRGRSRTSCALKEKCIIKDTTRASAVPYAVVEFDTTGRDGE